MTKKKGLIIEGMAEIAIALITVLLAVILLSCSASLNKNNKKEQGREAMDNAIVDNMFGMYLKRPVEIDGVSMTMSDLIVLVVEKERYSKTLPEDRRANPYWQAWVDNTFSYLGSYYINSDTPGYLVMLDVKITSSGDATDVRDVDLKNGNTILADKSKWPCKTAVLPSHSGTPINVVFCMHPDVIIK